MCGLAGIVHLDNQPITELEQRLTIMSDMIAHRGPDGSGIWVSNDRSVGLAHRRLAILDLSPLGAQPMAGDNGSVVVHNGEIYNFIELRKDLESGWRFKSGTDTEVLLAAINAWGLDAVERFRGMFAFAHWDPIKSRMICARDHFGIKPLYYAQVGRLFYFASEIKAILPFLPAIETDELAFAEYVTFQLPLGEETLFKGVRQLPPGWALEVKAGRVVQRPYWDVVYATAPRGMEETIEGFRSLFIESLDLHLRSDVPVGAYLSGGVDSSLIAIESSQRVAENGQFFHGKFLEYPGYDESMYAEAAAAHAKGKLHQIAITSNDFADNFAKVIWHLDHPVAGPGSFPQYMVSKLASEHVKVVLGGQGGDEVFGGYQRYLIAYLEQSLLGAMDGETAAADLPISLAELAPNLGSLREYRPLISTFFKSGMFGPLHDRYFRLVNRTIDLEGEIDLEALPLNDVYERYRNGFCSDGGPDCGHLERMMRWDFKNLLPALLQVEDRMAMAHGLESRVPFLDPRLVDYVAATPTAVKLQGGQMKHLLKASFGNSLPPQILGRRDKMGFPVPLKEWFSGPLRDYVHDILGSASARQRPWIRSDNVVTGLADMGRFSRKIWGFLSLEVWQTQFHDRAGEIRKAALKL